MFSQLLCFLQVNAIISKTSFWVKDDAVCRLTSDAEAERQWIRGCPCHEKECIDSARTGVPFECPNYAKGRNGPRWRKRVDLALQHFRYNQYTHRYNAEEDPDGTIYAGLHAGYSRLISQTILRFWLPEIFAVVSLGDSGAKQSGRGAHDVRD